VEGEKKISVFRGGKRVALLRSEQGEKKGGDFALPIFERGRKGLRSEGGGGGKREGRPPPPLLFKGGKR